MRAHLLAIAFGLVAVAACHGKSSSEAPPGNSGGGGGGERDYDERQACTADTDCVPVEVECCDHCNGGTVLGVHKDYADEVKQAFVSQEKCEGQACTLMACMEEPKGICRSGICGVAVGEREEVTPLPRP